jgi:hypothetical protein
MIKVYCDTSAYQPWLEEFSRRGDILLSGFPYENTNKRVKDKSIPSDPTWDQLYIRWCDAHYTWDDTNASEKFPDIITIIKKSGQIINTDAQHLDSAYKTGCHIFLTKDKTDILSRRQELEDLLGFKIFHPVEDRGSIIKSIYK